MQNFHMYVLITVSVKASGFLFVIFALIYYQIFAHLFFSHYLIMKVCLFLPWSMLHGLLILKDIFEWKTALKETFRTHFQKHFSLYVYCSGRFLREAFLRFLVCLFLFSFLSLVFFVFVMFAIVAIFGEAIEIKWLKKNLFNVYINFETNKAKVKEKLWKEFWVKCFFLLVLKLNLLYKILLNKYIFYYLIL